MSDTIDADEFQRRFTAELIRRKGETDGSGNSVGQYGYDAAGGYFSDPDLRPLGPEECARIDLDYWE